MPADNVTPFRPPEAARRARRRGGLGFKTHRGKVVLVHVLTLMAFTAAIIGTPLIDFCSPCVRDDVGLMRARADGSSARRGDRR